jgi:hypothetical protein
MKRSKWSGIFEANQFQTKEETKHEHYTRRNQGP